MSRFLLDANLSGRHVDYLAKRFGLDVVDLRSLGLEDLLDPDVVRFAMSQSRVIITKDRGLGTLCSRRFRGRIGAVVLRVERRSVEEINGFLNRVFRDSDVASAPLERSLVVVDAQKIRIRTFPVEECLDSAWVPRTLTNAEPSWSGHPDRV